MSKKDKIKLGITAILVLVLLAALGNARKTMNKVKDRRKKTLKSSVLSKDEKSNIPYEVLYPVEVKTNQTAGLYKKLDEEANKLSLKRDPFTKQAVKVFESSSERLALQGVIWNEVDPKAVINNKIVGVGDEISGHLVIEILANKVVLSDGLKSFELKLAR